jgi:hypothetical protein
MKQQRKEMRGIKKTTTEQCYTASGSAIRYYVDLVSGEGQPRFGSLPVAYHSVESPHDRTMDIAHSTGSDGCRS